jgi:hypothetical protein
MRCTWILRSGRSISSAGAQTILSNAYIKSIAVVESVTWERNNGWEIHIRVEGREYLIPWYALEGVPGFDRRNYLRREYSDAAFSEIKALIVPIIHEFKSFQLHGK